MANKKKGKTFSIRLTVLGVFFVVAASIAGLSLGLQYYFSSKLAKTAAERSFRATSNKVTERVQDLDGNSASIVASLGHFYTLETFPGPDREHGSLHLLGAVMENSPSFYAMYVGYDTGDFFEMINLASGTARKSFEALPHDRWVTIKVTNIDDIRKKTTAYLDSSFQIRIERQEASTYDPRGRPWYKKALASQGVVKTAPYLFSHLKGSGVTYAKSMNKGQRVVALDISREGMSGFLRKQRIFPHSHALIFNKKGDILSQATKEENLSKLAGSASIRLTENETAFITAHPIIRASNEMDWPPFDFAMGGRPKGYSVDLFNLISQKAGFKVQYVNGYSWVELMALFEKGELDLLHSLVKTSDREKVGVFSREYMPMPQAYAVRNGTPLPTLVSELKGKKIALPKGWATDTYLSTHYPYIKRLNVPTPLDAMQAVSSGKAFATLDSEPVLRYLATAYFLDDLTIGGHPQELNNGKGQGLHFMVQPEKSILAGVLNKALDAVTNEEQARLDSKWFGEDSAEETPKVTGTVPTRQLLALAETAGPQGDLKVITIKGREYFGYVAKIESVYGSDEFIGLFVPIEESLRPYMEMIRFSLMITLGLLLLLAPIVWYCASIIVKPINALSLESQKVKERRYKDVGMVQSNITEILGLSRSMVSMASSIKAHEESLKELMDSFIKLIATAIDHKSPYTGGHCARVPELSVMLAKAADGCTEGPLAGFSFKTDEEWREFRTAAWLHDCGKVTTPEYIVDKATKLETIYNRIHEVRMRFEVLLRDARIEYWQGVANGGDKAVLQQDLGAKQQAIKNDFAFIAQSNLGGEFMEEDRVDRVNKIAQKTWERHLDDRLGLGHIELARYPKEVPDLPCREYLLADRSEHIIERHEKGNLGSPDSGFAMEVPEYLYNLGEIYNLSISRGTLTAEDRYKINEHITTTIQMLETLPYPDNMTRIPEYAGAHHETLIGTGYPRKLTAKDIGIPGRILAVADVFEALTASDRPYKKAKTLSEALRILNFMVKDKHLDADLFRLFLESGVYMDYARRFLGPSQIDDPDVSEYIASLK